MDLKLLANGRDVELGLEHRVVHTAYTPLQILPKSVLPVQAMRSKRAGEWKRENLCTSDERSSCKIWALCFSSVFVWSPVVWERNMDSNNVIAMLSFGKSRRVEEPQRYSLWAKELPPIAPWEKDNSQTCCRPLKQLTRRYLLASCGVWQYIVHVSAYWKHAVSVILLKIIQVV